MKNKIRIIHTLIVAVLFLASCNLPTDQDTQAAEQTAAAQTVEALFSLTPTASLTPIAATFTPFPTLTVNTNTPAATATSNCNVAQFITDVTIPDGTVFAPGAAFTKKWRIKNIGSCAWSGFSMTFDSGDSMGGPASKPVAAVNPGQEIDLEVNLTAPASAGNYRGYWRLVTSGNVLVPMVNGYQGKSFYVDIKVQTGPTNTAAAFAVTSVIYNVSGTCGNFHVSANITTNGPGNITFYWQANGSDDFEGTYGSTLSFVAAETKTTPTIDWSISAAGDHYLRVYIDTPNHQFISQSGNMHCP
jgi:hypothetical protein